MSKLINQTQPFGVHSDHNMHPGAQNGPGPHHNAVSDMTEIDNHGADQVVSFADKGAGSYEKACEYKFNPFHWTGRPKR